MRGMSALRVAIGFACLAVLVVGWLLLLREERARQRDLVRLATVRQAEAAFRMLYLKTASFRSAAENGCGQPNSPLATCNFTAIGWPADAFQNPAGAPLLVATPPDDEQYAITFTLERSHDGIAAGRHTLTPDGIR